MQATDMNLAAVEARSRVNGGNALAGGQLDLIAGRGGKKPMRLYIDWPKDDVVFPVGIYVRNRGGLGGMITRSVVWARRLRIIGNIRRQGSGKQTPRKGLRSIGTRQSWVPALASGSGAEAGAQVMEPDCRTRL
jgi:hypothetical protein